MKWGESRSEERARLAAKEFPFTEPTRKRLGLRQFRSRPQRPQPKSSDAKRAVVVLGLTAAFLAGTTPAVEAGPPEAAAKFMPDHGRLSVVQKPGPGACNTVEHTETVYNRWNVKMVSLSQEVYYCWGRVKKKHVLTAARFTKRVWTRPITPWRYDGPDSVTRWGGRGQFEAGRTIQGKFHFCVLWYCPEAHPWVTQRVFGIGLYYGDGEAG